MTATSSPPDTTTSASSASASDSTSTGSDDSGSTWAFITDPPCTGEPCSYTCDQWEQDCPEGEACKPWSDDGGNAWNSTRCTPLSPDPAQVGDPCTLEGPGLSGFDDCDIGSTCYHLDEALEGTCVELCDGTEQDPFCADPDRICTISNEGALTLCLIACNPSADECPPQFECQPYEDGGVCVLPSGAGG